MRWWPWERAEKTVTIKVSGEDRIRELELENQYLFQNYKMARDDNYRILENKALREKLKAQKQAVADVREHYKLQVKRLADIIIEQNRLVVLQRQQLQELKQSNALLSSRACNHLGTAVTVSRVGNDEIIEVTNEKSEVTWRAVIRSEAKISAAIVAEAVEEATNLDTDERQLAMPAEPPAPAAGGEQSGG